MAMVLRRHLAIVSALCLVALVALVALSGPSGGQVADNTAGNTIDEGEKLRNVFLGYGDRLWGPPGPEAFTGCAPFSLLMSSLKRPAYEYTEAHPYNMNPPQGTAPTEGQVNEGKKKRYDKDNPATGTPPKRDPSLDSHLWDGRYTDRRDGKNLAYDEDYEGTYRIIGQDGRVHTFTGFLRSYIYVKGYVRLPGEWTNKDCIPSPADIVSHNPHPPFDPSRLEGTSQDASIRCDYEGGSVGYKANMPSLVVGRCSITNLATGETVSARTREERRQRSDICYAPDDAAGCYAAVYKEDLGGQTEVPPSATTTTTFPVQVPGLPTPTLPSLGGTSPTTRPGGGAPAPVESAPTEPPTPEAPGTTPRPPGAPPTPGGTGTASPGRPALPSTTAFAPGAQAPTAPAPTGAPVPSGGVVPSGAGAAGFVPASAPGAVSLSVAAPVPVGVFPVAQQPEGAPNYAMVRHVRSSPVSGPAFATGLGLWFLFVCAVGTKAAAARHHLTSSAYSVAYESHRAPPRQSPDR